MQESEIEPVAPEQNRSKTRKVHNVPNPPPKSLDRLDLLSALGDVTAVSGASVGYFSQIAGPVMNVVGVATTQLSNYYNNRKARDEIRALIEDFRREQIKHQDQVNVEFSGIEFADKFGLEINKFSSILTAITLIVALTSTSLAIAYNILKRNKDRDIPALLVLSIALGLLAPILEKIMQHYKKDNLAREKVRYEKALTFFKPPYVGDPVQPEIEAKESDLKKRA